MQGPVHYARSAVLTVFEKVFFVSVIVLRRNVKRHHLEKSSFLHTLYLKNEAKTIKNKYRAAFNTFKRTSMRNLELL